MSRTVKIALLIAVLLTRAVHAASAEPTPAAPAAASPGSVTGFAPAAGPCPTFSWGAVEGAVRYELAVYGVDDTRESADAGLVPVLGQSLPGSVLAWTPPLDRCPEAGGNYAWTVRAVLENAETGWSESRLFRIADVPTTTEVEEALAVLRRYVSQGLGRDLTWAPPGAARDLGDREGGPKVGTGVPVAKRGRRSDEPEAAEQRGGRLGPLFESIRSGARPVESISPRIVTFPSSYSLGLEGDAVIEGNVFKEGYALLHTDGGFASGNTALGLDALVSATPDVPDAFDGEFNSAFGRAALRNNTEGSFNTAAGTATLYSNTTGRNNTAIGAYALGNNTTGTMNTATGAGSLYGNTTGSNNTALGRSSLEDNTAGSSNTAVGDEALRVNTTGSYNTAIGDAALLVNTTGVYNTAAGASALESNTTGNSNTAVGQYALLANTTTGLNTALGRSALASNIANRNTALGAFALFQNTTGFANTAAGASAMAQNTTGIQNTGVGYLALEINISGSENTALGALALAHNTSGDQNSGFGKYALSENTTGARNTAVGENALLSNTAGQQNTAVGQGALSLSTEGSDNIALGRRAGRNNTTGSNSIFIGSEGDAGDGVDASSEVIRIGTNQDLAFIAGIAGATVNDATVMIDTATGQLGIAASSRRFKEEIVELDDVSERLLALRPVRFRYRPEVTGDADRPVEFGLIAEEVAEVYPELVIYDERGEPYTVRYQALMPLLLSEVQRLHRLVANQRRQNFSIAEPRGSLPSPTPYRRMRP